MELLKAYELAYEFNDYSKDLQILITTHSPAFYSLARDNRAFCYYAQISNDSTQYEKVNQSDFGKVNESMGVLQIITPYIDEAVKRQADLQSTIQSLQTEVEKQKLPVLYVEGITEKAIFEAYFKVKRLKRKINIIASQQFGGVSFVHDSLLAWAYSRNTEVALGLFDRDDAGQKYNNLVINNTKVQASIYKKRIIPLLLHMPNHLSNIYKKNVILPIMLEELFPPEAWKHAQGRNWLTERANVRNFMNFDIPNDKSLQQVLKDLGFSENDLRYILYTVKDTSKVPFAEYIAANIFNSDYQAGLQKIYDKINSLL